MTWGDLTIPEQMILADAQTSGGLLLGIDDPAPLLAALDGAAVVGRVGGGTAGRIQVEGRIDA